MLKGSEYTGEERTGCTGRTSDIGRVIMGEEGHLHWLYWDREDNKTAGW